MAGEKRFTRIPPESTGDRMFMIHTAEIEFKNGGSSTTATYGNHTWRVDDIYSVSGFGGVHLVGVYDRGNGTGFLTVHYSETNRYENLEPAADALISLGGTTVGQVVSAYDVYIPAQNIVGYDNPEYGLDIDPEGSAKITFAEGKPQLDAWGKLRISGATSLGKYVFSDKTVLDDNFSRVRTQAGPSAVPHNTTAFVTYNDTRKGVDIGVSNPSDLGASTSFTYHHYIAGSSHLFMGTCLFSGSGTITNPVATGVSRRFGPFDLNNGFMFNVGPDGVLYLEKRSSNSGTKVDTLLACSDPATAALLGIDVFNGDRVNGQLGIFNVSGVNLDLSKNNQYWIDLQWHGAGRVRFGIFHDGKRVTIHEYYHNNRFTLPMNQSASTPTCTAVYAYTQSEIDSDPNWSKISGLTGASADTPVFIRIFSQAMWTETDINLQAIGKPHTYASSHMPVTDSDFQYMFSMRPNPLNDNGSTNHSLYIPTRVVVISYDNNVTTTGMDRSAMVHWRMSVETVHHGHEFEDIPGTGMQVSTSGTNFEATDVTNRILEDMYIGRGEKDLTNTFIDFQNGAWKNRSDDGGTLFQNISSISGSSTGTVTATADASASTTLLLTSTSSLIVGSVLSGPNIPAGTYVEKVIDATSVIINQATTGSFSGGETINFTNPISVTIDTNQHDRWKLKEPYPKTFGANPGNGLYRLKNFDGLSLSTPDVYLFITGLTTGVLFADENWTTPITSTGTYTGSNATIFGHRGPEYVISFYTHEQVGYQDPRAMFVVEWKEIGQ